MVEPEHETHVVILSGKRQRDASGVPRRDCRYFKQFMVLWGYQYLKDALIQSESIDFKRGEASSYYYIGAFDFKRGNYYRAMDNLEKAKEIYSEMEQIMGRVPSFMKLIPEDSLDAEWNLFKRTIFGETAIPNKYKELIGLAVAAATFCRYCAAFHAVSAKLFGATDAEIEDAVHVAKNSAGWSTYMNGMSIDFDDFNTELNLIADYIKANS